MTGAFSRDERTRRPGAARSPNQDGCIGTERNYPPLAIFFTGRGLLLLTQGVRERFAAW